MGSSEIAEKSPKRNSLHVRNFKSDFKQTAIVEALLSEIKA